MIPDQWYAVLESREVSAKKPLGVTRLGEQLVFWRDRQGRLACMRDRCPHRGVALSAGAIVGDHIQCPFHGFEFERSGACELIPANGLTAKPPRGIRVDTFPVREAHGLVYLWWGESREEYPPLPYFAALDDGFEYASIQDPWPTHYSRAIENQLDVVHLPFVHHNTIGRGNKTLVHGPIFRETEDSAGNLLEIWVHNERDHGQPPDHAHDEPPARPPQLQFRFPNVWHNWISDDVRVFIAFAPVDDENTRMYLRYYHRTHTPLLKQLHGWLGSLANLIIERQDKRVVVTQRPRRSELHGDEKLIVGDRPIIAYRRTRERLIAESRKSSESTPSPRLDSTSE